jgi:hypothetical protein
MADLDIARSLRWHDPGRFNGYVLSQHVAGTPVDVVNLRDALPVVKEISSWNFFTFNGSTALASGRRLSGRSTLKRGQR